VFFNQSFFQNASDLVVYARLKTENKRSKVKTLKLCFVHALLTKRKQIYKNVGNIHICSFNFLVSFSEPVLVKSQRSAGASPGFRRLLYHFCSFLLNRHFYQSFCYLFCCFSLMKIAPPVRRLQRRMSNWDVTLLGTEEGEKPQNIPLMYVKNC